MVSPQFVMYEEEFNRISAICDRLCRESNSKVVFLVDKNGQLIAAAGQVENLDTTSLASLTAGNIAATNFRYDTWLTEAVTGAARAMQVSLRSAWLLVEIWNNGATVWESPGGNLLATVTPEGEIGIERSGYGDDAEQLADDAR